MPCILDCGLELRRTTLRRRLRAAILASVLGLAAAGSSFGFNLRETPPGNRLTMNLLLGESPMNFIDSGPHTWNEAAIQALMHWNGVGIGSPRDPAFFSWAGGPGQVAPASPANACIRDGVNSVVFASRYCNDMSFGGAIALAISRSIDTGIGFRTVETDVIFDANLTWDVYAGPILGSGSGPAPLDLRRVALHEFGHAAGLKHPDDIGQSVAAIMNSHVSAIDAAQADDVAGAHAITWSALPTQALFSSLLPISRSVTVGTPATVFATVINAGSDFAVDCGVSLDSPIPATFTYQTTDRNTNQLSGTPDTPVVLAAAQSQSFVLSLVPSAPFEATAVRFRFDCANNEPAGVIDGVNTLLVSGNAAAVPDVIALAATVSADGIVNVPDAAGTGAFAVASANVGSGGEISVAADTGAAALPLALTVCRTNPADGTCMLPPSASVSTTIGGGETPTFAVFVRGTGAAVPFDPARSRVFVRFRDAGGAVRGATSVAVRTL